MNSISNNVKRIIREKGLKQKYIAEKMGITERKLSDILNGRKVIDEGIIMSLYDTLNVEPNELFGYDKSA